MKKITKLALALAVTFAVSGNITGSAFAADLSNTSGTTWDSTASTTSVDPDCVAQVTLQAPSASVEAVNSACTVTTVIKSRVDQVTTQPTTLTRIATSPIYSKSWEIDKIGITYYEITKGKFYYDGSQAWSTKTYRGLTGSHECQAPGSWGVTVAVSVEGCTSSYSTSGDAVTDRETYKVSAFVNGFPVYWVYAMSELSKADGTTTARDF